MSMLGQIGRVLKRVGLSDRRYRFLFDAEPGNEVVSLDCETTGFDPWVDEIVSVAAIRIVGRRIHASSAFRALVKPDAAIRPTSIKVHRLREIDVAGARPMSEVLPELLQFIGSRPLVGY
jgi:DNA polymerase III subunit epsilon